MACRGQKQHADYACVNCGNCSWHCACPKVAPVKKPEHPQDTSWADAIERAYSPLNGSER